MAYHPLFRDNKLLYKDTYLNHPYNIWTRKSIDHYSWLVQYFDDLTKEKIKRDGAMKNTNKIYSHKSWQDLFELFKSQQLNEYKKISSKFFGFNCTDIKDESDVRVSYRKQMEKKWQNDLMPPKWTGRNKPDFMVRNMHIDKNRRIWFSKEEMKVIKGVLHALSFQMWKAEKTKECRNIKAKFSCSIEDLKYAKDWFTSFYSERKQSAYIFLFEDASRRLSVISAALAQCDKNFKEYKVSAFGRITQEEIKKVFQDFQKLLATLETIRSDVQNKF